MSGACGAGGKVQRGKSLISRKLDSSRKDRPPFSLTYTMAGSVPTYTSLGRVGWTDIVQISR